MPDPKGKEAIQRRGIFPGPPGIGRAVSPSREEIHSEPPRIGVIGGDSPVDRAAFDTQGDASWIEIPPGPAMSGLSFQG